MGCNAAPLSARGAHPWAAFSAGYKPTIVQGKDSQHNTAETQSQAPAKAPQYNNLANCRSTKPTGCNPWAWRNGQLVPVRFLVLLSYCS